MHKNIAWAILGCVSALFIGSSAFAQIESTPIPTNPKPNFSAMKFLVGTWNCSETNTRRPAAYTRTTTTTMDPSGYWMVNTTVNHPSSWAPHSITNVDKVTYDASTSRWVDVATDDQGGYDVSYSTGWKDGTITWTDALYPKTSGISSSGATITTKQSDTKYTYTSSFKETSGRTVSVKGTCTKT